MMLSAARLREVVREQLAPRLPAQLKRVLSMGICAVRNTGRFAFAGEIRLGTVPLRRADPTARIHVISPPGITAAPALASANLSKDSRHLRGRVYHVPEDFVARSERWLFCSRNNAFLTTEGRYIRESINTLDSFYYDHARRHRRELGSAVPLTGTVAPLRARHWNHYHTLLDTLPRLASLATATEFLGDGVALVHCGALSPLEAWLVPRLMPPGGKLVEVAHGPLYRPESALLATFKTRDHSGFLPARYVDRLRACTTAEMTAGPPRRLLISRGTVPGRARAITNEEELGIALAPFGVERIVLEQLPPEAQAKAFLDAELVIGAHGAGLANLIFSPRATVIEIFPTATVIPHYLLLAQALGLVYRRVHGTGYRVNGPFTAPVAHVRSVVAEWAQRHP